MSRTIQEAEISGRLLLLAENLNVELSETRLTFLLEGLGGLDFERVIKAFDHLARTCKFFPPLAEILETMGEKPEKLEDPLQVQAELQWQKLLRAPNEPSHYRVFMGRDADGNARYQAVDDGLDQISRMAYRSMGGTKTAWTDSNLDFKRRTFIELYLRFGRSEHKMLPENADARVLKLVQRTVQSIEKKDILTK